MTRISVVIPTFQEVMNIGKCVAALLAEPCFIEIIIADGGSTDSTKEIAAGYPGVKVVDSIRGRGVQMNAGAAVATGDVLLFLHADTHLEKGWMHCMLDGLEDSSIIGGAFTFSVDSPSWKYRLVEAWVKLRCALCNLPYGDQAIFIRAGIFRQLGGYRDIPLMEDVDLIGRMKKTGRTTILAKKAFTSERRWKGKGVIRTALINQATMMLYKLGASPETLFRLYYR